MTPCQDSAGRFYTAEGDWDLLGRNWPEGASARTSAFGWLRGPDLNQRLFGVEPSGPEEAQKRPFERRHLKASSFGHIVYGASLTMARQRSESSLTATAKVREVRGPTFASCQHVTLHPDLFVLIDLRLSC